MSLGTKGNYKEGREIFLAIVLLCNYKLAWASGSKATGLRQFSKVRSSKRDFVDRCKFHCFCESECESVFIKYLDRLGATVR